MGGGLRVIVLNPKFKFVWFYQGFFGFGIGIPISIFCLIFWRTQIWNLVIQNEDCKVLSEQVCIEVPKQICRSQPQKSCCPSNKQQCIKETSALVAWFWWWLGFSFIDPPSQPCLGDSIVTFPFQNGTEKGPTGYFFSQKWFWYKFIVSLSFEGAGLQRSDMESRNFLCFLKINQNKIWI